MGLVPQRRESPNSRKIEGKSFYSPETIAFYTILCFPIGFALYGLNVLKRGHRLIGAMLIGFSGALYAMFLLGSMSGVGIHGVGLIGVVIAPGLINLEGTPYAQVLARGGRKARSWPPLLWVLALFASGILCSAVSVPGDMSG